MNINNISNDCVILKTDIGDIYIYIKTDSNKKLAVLSDLVANWIEDFVGYMQDLNMQGLNISYSYDTYDTRTDAEVCTMCEKQNDPDYCNHKCPLFPF